MRKSVLRLSVGALVFHGALFADCDCSDNYYKQWVGIGHSEGSGIGFNDGYTTFSTFLTAQKDFFCFCPIMDIRWHVFNGGKSAGNFGLGARTFFNDYEAMAGVNLFYDFRQTRAKTFHQMGFGLEWSSLCWDFIANAYIPVGRMRSHFYNNKRDEICSTTFEGFSGHNVLIGPSITQISRKRDFNFGGFDLQARRTIFDNGTIYFDAGIGSYFYTGNYKRDVYGGLCEVTANVLDTVIVSGRVNYDTVFHTTGNVQLTVQIPFGCGFYGRRDPCNPCETLQRKLVRTVKRQEIIPTKIEKERIRKIDPNFGIAVDPYGDPFNFFFVNNLNPEPGDGTFENPFNSFLVAESETFYGETIYVFPGDGTTAGMDTGFTFKDNQVLIGSGAPYPLETLCGELIIPASSYPMVTNVSGDAFTLANDNILSGFNIAAPSGSGVSGSGIMNATILNNIVTNPDSVKGIIFIDASGYLSVANNVISSNFITPLTQASGISVTGNGNFADVNISNNTITNFSSGIRVYELNDSMMNSTISNNIVITSMDIGIDLSSFVGGFNTNSISGNVIEGATNYGIVVFANESSTKTAEIVGNQVSNSGLDGILTGTDNSGHLVVSVRDNVLTNNPFLAQNENTICLSLTSNNSNLGYTLNNLNGPTSTFNVEPFTPPNIGPLTEIGIITPVPVGFCEE